MSDTTASFARHLAKSLPRFSCEPAGGESAKRTFTGNVKHRLQPPASLEAIQQIRRILGKHAKEFEALYRMFDGAVLYEDTIAFEWYGRQWHAAGLEFYAVNTWEANTLEMRKSLDFLASNDDTVAPDWYCAGYAFAGLPMSGYYFVVSVAKGSEGSVTYASHDPSPQSEFVVPSLDRFLHCLMADPAQFFYDRGCYLRLRDGLTPTQWIPRKFASGPNKRSKRKPKDTG